MPGKLGAMKRNLWVLTGLMLALLLVGLIAAGVFDPKPVGQQIWQQTLPAYPLPTQTQQLWWLDDPLPPTDFSLRLTAALADGDPFTSYGLALGDPAAPLVVTVSPLGYVAIQQGSRDVLPFQTWPHVRGGQGSNEIWVDVVDTAVSNSVSNAVTIRINRELLWTGTIDPLPRQVGLIAETFATPATIQFQTLTLFTDDSSNGR